MAAAGYGPIASGSIRRVVRGLEYYTGPVFEAELTFAVTNEDGQPVRFGSVAAAGATTGSSARFRGEPVPATGFSIGVSRLFAALKPWAARSWPAPRPPGRWWCWCWTGTSMADYQGLVAQLRAAGIRAEIYLGSAGMKAQLKYADRRHAPVAVIQGSNERPAGEVQIKDLIEGARAAESSPTTPSGRRRGRPSFPARRPIWWRRSAPCWPGISHPPPVETPRLRPR